MASVTANRSPAAFARLAGLVCAALGLFVLAGWALSVPWIKSVLPGAVEMKANAAVGLLLSGAALALLAAPGSSRRTRFGFVLATVVAILGLATLGEFLFGWQLGIDELLVRDTADAFNPFRGRMSPYSAVVFATMGVGLMALPKRSLHWLVSTTAIATILIGGVSFIGYLWNASELVTDRILPPVAIHTAAAFLLLGAGLLAAGRRTAAHASGTAPSFSSIELKSLLGFLATLVLLLLAGGMTYRATVTAAESARTVAHTQQVRASLGLLYAAVSGAESQHRNYLLSSSPADREDYRRHAAEAAAEARTLAGLVADNPAQSQRLRELQAVVSARVSLLDHTTAIFEKSGLAAAQQIIRSGEGGNLMGSIRSLVDRMDSTEEKLLAAREARTLRGNTSTLSLLLITLAVAVAGFLLLFGTIRREMATRARAEEELERFFTLSLDFLGIASADGYFKRVSPAVTDMLGWTVGEFLATPFLELVHPDDRAATLAEVERQVVAGERVLQFENRYRHKDGSWRVLSWRSVPQPGGLMYATARDVTDFKRAEETLRRSEESLTVTLLSIGDGVLATDTAGTITRMNPIAETLTGWTQADARGRPIGEVFRIINEATRAAAVVPVEKVLATGEIQGLANHTALIARDGTECPIADSAAPIRARDGHILGVVLVFRDVSAERAAEKALRESETRFRTLFESIDEGFCIIEMIFDERERPVDYRFIVINPSFEKQTGLHNALGQRMRELAPKHEAHWFEIYGRIATTGEPERFQNRAEQLHRTYDVYAFRIGNPASRHVAILFNDITERKEAEERVERLNADLHGRARELEAANHELEAFSYSVSHDLRAPLRHVHGYVEMLTREIQDHLSDKARRYLQTIKDANAEMANLIDELLAFSRMSRAEMSVHVVDLNPLVRDALEGLELATRDRNIVWRIAPLPPALGDPAMLLQVFANLLGNAVKYTRPRDPAIIEVAAGGEEDGRRIFFVRDNGAGFDMKYADKLFGVFQRLHRADEFEGTGIGLANVRRIVARHGGRTWGEGKVGEGATFYFTLAPAPSAPSSADSPSSLQSSP